MGALALVSLQAVSAPETGTDVSKEISDLHSTITSAELYTISNGLSFRIGLKERDVVRMGCHYSAVEKNDVTSLLDVLVNAQLVEPPEQIPTLEPRIVVHLHTREGAVIPLVLSREFINGPARGTYNNTTPVAAKMGFGAELLNWKKQRKPVRDNELMCHGTFTIFEEH
jgi:hypothetical protein